MLGLITKMLRSLHKTFQYTIVLPDVGGEELDAVISILYGSALTVSPALAPKIHTLADMLGIAVDLVKWITPKMFKSTFQPIVEVE